MDKEPTDESLETTEISASAIDNILPTSNEDEMKNLMKDLDREQAYREHKCSVQHTWPLFSFLLSCFSLQQKRCLATHCPSMMFYWVLQEPAAGCI